MASEDVIELGSSEDEAEPLPKRKKPTPIPMVHIPGFTVKSSRSSSSPNNKSAKLVTKPIRISNSKNLIIAKKSTTHNKMPIQNITANVKMPIQNRIANESKTVPFVKFRGAINPMNIVKKLNKSEVVIKKMSSTTNVQRTITTHEQKVLTKLPSSITVKPIYKPSVTIKPVYKPGASGVNKRGKIVPLKGKPPGEMLTVEIDDDDTSELHKASPQWYLRPEDQKEKTVTNDINDKDMEVDSEEPSIEEKNNREPDTKRYVEITIEDSPLKPAINTMHHDIGKELTITIEDSPVKPIPTNTKEVESDSEMNTVMEDKQSKKKLDYPKEFDSSKENQVVEIEIDLSGSTTVLESEQKSTNVSPEPKPNKETKKSPKQDSDTEKHNAKNEPSAQEVNDSIAQDDEFNPTYQKFIQMCFQLENTDDMKKIVEKKIKAYYRQCPKEYVESEEFIDMVSSKTTSMKASPAKMYLYIKDIVDELNLQRKMPKPTITEKDKIGTEEESTSVKYDESQYDNKKRRQIRKLEKTIKKLHRAIQKLEDQEVDFDDEEDSVYLLTERYKERMVRVHAKFCQLTNTKMPSEPRIHVEARPGRATGPAKKLEKWINRKVPIGTPLPFPDFHDVIRCVRVANEEDKLGWTDIDVMEEARDLFTRCGKKLQRRRQENEWRIAASRISTELDPAESSSDLKKKLDENKSEAAKRETELLNKYVDRQNLLKLEAEEIGDKEAEESPIESEEDELGEIDNAMEDKHKRKERLKRLLQEKSKKGDERENPARVDSETKEECNDTQLNINKDSIEGKSNTVEMIVEPIPVEAKEADVKETETENSTKNKENEDSDCSSYKVDSDIDELGLLQKLHSENDANTSTLESSDSETPIAISDTLDSDTEHENGPKSCDVISIENSSYSESEMIVEGPSKVYKTQSLCQENIEELVTDSFEIEYSSTEIKERKKDNNNDTINEVEENILLASSDEDVKDMADNIEIENTYINLRDDSISISETVIGESNGTGNVSNETLQNENSVKLAEESLSVEQNDYASDVMQKKIEGDDNNQSIQSIICGSTVPECLSNDVDIPKDIVEVRSTSDVNSVESTDLLTDNENEVVINDHIERTNVIDSNTDTQNKDESLETLKNDQSDGTETSNCNTNMDI